MGEPIRRVAVAGTGDLAETLSEAARTAGARIVADGDASADPDVTIAVGADAIRSTVASEPDALVVPVGDRQFAFGPDDATEAVHRLIGVDGSAAVDSVEGVRRVAHTVLAVDTGGGTVRAVDDVALVTAQPARISEFGVGGSGWDSSFRADGVVVATPFGSDGYANAAGGPVIEPGGGLGVVPIAPFSTRTNPRIVTDRVVLSVERDEEPVSLVVDGDALGTVDPHRPVTIEAVARVDALAPTATAPSRARRSETL